MNNAAVPVIGQIETMVKDVPGWTPIDQLYTLFSIAFLTADVEGDIVEIGSWCGRSTIVLGLAAQLAGNSRIYCADLFPAKSDWMANPDGTYSFEVVINGKRFGGHKENPVWKEPFETQIRKIYEKYENVLDWFNETIASRGMRDIVHPHKGDLGSLLEHLGPDFKCRLAFLDADHGFQAVSSDIRIIDRCLVPGGWICFDDAFTVYEGVSRAISELILQNPRYERCQQMTRKLFVARKNANAA